MLRRPRFALALCALSLMISGPAMARTYLVPHFVQTDDPSSTQYSINTRLDLTYVPGLVDLEPTPGATVDVYLFDQNGVIIESATAQPVCNPCSFGLNAGLRRVPVSLYSQFVNAGGFASPVHTGFILLEVSGDADHVALGSTISNTHTSAFDIDTAMQKVIEVPGGLSATGRLIVFPQIVESDDPSSDPFSFDTTIYAAYAGGIPGSSIPAGSGATVSLWLFENNGAPMQSLSASNVCSPCIETVSAGDPRAQFSLQQRFDLTGGASPVELGFALMVITGSADAVAVEGLVINSHTSAFDLSITELEQVEVPYSPPPTSVTPPPAGAWLHSFPNPVQPFTRIEYSVARGGPVTVEIVDVSGRIVARPVSRHQDAGSYDLQWSGRGDAGEALPSGVYFARLSSPDGVRVVKMTLLR